MTLLGECPGCAECDAMADPQDQQVIELARILYGTLDERGAAGRNLDHEPSSVKHWWAGKAYLVLQKLRDKFLDQAMRPEVHVIRGGGS